MKGDDIVLDNKGHNFPTSLVIAIVLEQLGDQINIKENEVVEIVQKVENQLAADYEERFNNLDLESEQEEDFAQLQIWLTSSIKAAVLPEINRINEKYRDLTKSHVLSIFKQIDTKNNSTELTKLTEHIISSYI